MDVGRSGMNKTKAFRLGSDIKNIINLYGSEKLEYVISQTMFIKLQYKFIVIITKR